MQELLKYIENHGIAVVFFVVMLVFLIKFGNIWLKIYTEKNMVKKHDDLYLLRTQIGVTISGILKNIIYETRASRVYVFEFHNGVTSLGGLPIPEDDKYV